MGWYERLTRWSEDHRFVVDLCGTLVLGALVATAATGLNAYATAPGGSTGTILWSLAVVAPLPWARTRPVASAVAVYTAALGHMLAGFPLLLPTDFVVPGSLYALTVYGPRWAYRAGMASAAAGSVAVGVATWWSLGAGLSAVPVTMFALLTFLSVFGFALVRRGRRTMLVAMRERAVRLEVERDQQARIATAAERARIAREMHDIVAHSLSVVIAQADGGRYAAAHDPEAATHALGTIAETGRVALTEMRRLLGVLRVEPAPLREHDPAAGTGGLSGDLSGDLAAGAGALAGAAHDGAARPTPPAPLSPLSPQPDVTEIERLVDQVRESGVRVSVVRVGTERNLPPGVGLTLYRVCQEALTNVLKHAGPAPQVNVLLRFGEREVELGVEDDGRGLAAVGASAGGSTGGSAGRAADAGYGLTGMRERAALFGGSLTAGPRPGGGFRVRMTVPVPPLAEDPLAGPRAAATRSHP